MYTAQQLRRNISKLYLFAFFQTFLIIMPVLVVYWQDKGLNLREVFLLQGIFGAVLLLCDVPAGYLADLFGRKLSLIIGSSINAIAFSYFCFANSFAEFAIFEVIIGIGMSLNSGCDVALLYASTESLKSSKRKAAYLGHRMTAIGLGEGMASLIGGLLASLSLLYPAYATALAMWIPVVIACTLIEPESERMTRESHFKNMKDIGQALFGQGPLLTFAILNLIFYSLATYCSVWLAQPFWKERGVPIAYFGYLWASLHFIIAIVARYAHWVEDRLGSWQTVAFIGILPIVGYLGMSALPGLWALPLMIAFPICRGLNSVIFQDAINQRVPSRMRATTNSIGSLGFRIVFLLFGPLIGHLIDSKGVNAALMVLGLIYLLIFFSIALPLISCGHRWPGDAS